MIKEPDNKFEEGDIIQSDQGKRFQVLEIYYSYTVDTWQYKSFPLESDDGSKRNFISFTFEYAYEKVGDSE